MRPSTWSHPVTWERVKFSASGKTNLYNRSHFHQMARMKKRVHKANEDESQNSTKKAVAPVVVVTPVEEALMASEERRSTLHMPL